MATWPRDAGARPHASLVATGGRVFPTWARAIVHEEP